MRYLLLSIIIISLVGILMVPNAFAKEVKVQNAPGSSVPGCEKFNGCFIPNRVSIDPGDTVTWTNPDTMMHIVTSGTTTGGPDGTFNSNFILAGKTFSYQFIKSGAYSYFCSAHPWMEGTVVVREGSYSPPPSKIYSNIILDPLPTTFNAKGPNSRADVTFSGELESADKKFFLKSATITLKFTGFTVDGKKYYEITTDNKGKFNKVFTLPPGNGYAIQAVFDGSDSTSGNIWTSSKSQIEYFSVKSSQPSAPSSTSKIYSNIILDPLPTTFNAKGPNSRADVTFSGELESADKKFFLKSATITLKFTGFTVDGKKYYEITTDNKGKFNKVFTLPPGNGYAIQAVFDGVKDGEDDTWTSSKSQIEYFSVKSSSLSQPTSSVGEPTFLKLEIETDKRDVTVKGKLTEKGKNSPARNVQITLIPTGFAFNSITAANMGYCKISELPNCELTTDNFGNFKVKLTLPQNSIGKKYSIQAISASNNQWESSKSLTQSFTITSSSQSQPPTQSSGVAGMEWIMILIPVIIIVGVVVAIKRKKKTPKATPQRKTFGAKQPKKRRTVGSPVGASSSTDGPSTYGYFECPNCHEPSAPQGKLRQNPDGTQFCSKCGWDSEV